MGKNNQIVARAGSALVKRPESVEPVVTPVADIYETTEAFVVKLDVPGAAKESIEVSAERDRLTVKCPVGPYQSEFAKVVYSETGRKSYFREFHLGEGIEYKKIEATFENAVLTISLPKSESMKARVIHIQ